jgi:hypothetical protein
MEVMAILRRGWVAVLAVLACGVGPVWAGDKGEKKGDPGGKTIVLHLDASKLPPEVLSQLLKIAGGKEGGAVAKVGKGGKVKGKRKGAESKKGQPEKTITLVQAVAIAEKLTAGSAVKAERVDQPKQHFSVDVLGADGKKQSVQVSPQGDVLSGKEAKGGDTKVPEKGKKSGK